MCLKVILRFICALRFVSFYYKLVILHDILFIKKNLKSVILVFATFYYLLNKILIIYKKTFTIYQPCKKVKYNSKGKKYFFLKFLFFYPEGVI